MTEPFSSTDPEIVAFTRAWLGTDAERGADFPSSEAAAAFVAGCINDRIHHPEANGVRVSFEGWREEKARAAAAPATSQPALNRPAPPPASPSAPAAPSSVPTTIVGPETRSSNLNSLKRIGENQAQYYARLIRERWAHRPAIAAEVQRFLEERWVAEGEAFRSHKPGLERADWERWRRGAIAGCDRSWSGRRELREFESWLAGRGA